MIEGVLIVLALLCGVTIRFWNQPAELEAIVQFPDFAFRISMIVLIMLVSFYCGNLYSQTIGGRTWRQLFSLAHSLGVGCLILGIIYFFFPQLIIGRGVFLISFILMGLGVLTCRLTLDRVWNLAPARENFLILGTRNAAQAVARELENRREDLNFRLAGFVSASEPGDPGVIEEKTLGPLADLQNLVARHKVSRIVVALENRRGTLPLHDLVTLRMRGVEIVDAPTALAALTGRVWLDLLQPSWFIFQSGFRRSSVTLWLKRLVDVLLASIGFILTAPVMLIVAALVKLDSRGPALYRQTRVGLNGRHFELLKFRSMRTDAEKYTGAQWAQQNDPRVTRLGRFLRKFRLDELPQFVNILRGDMSFVGPRPERPVFVHQLKQVIPYYDERHFVRPGLTGWAQVEYNYGASLEDAARKLEYDLFYLKNMSVMLDLLIVLKTVKVVLSGSQSR